MSYYRDLGECDYFSGKYKAVLIAVGWLEAGRPYSRGKTPRAIRVRLASLLNAPWEPSHYKGWHSCDLCGALNHRLLNVLNWHGLWHWSNTRSIHNVFIPNGDTIFVAPEAILHYICVHKYRPPQEFCDAVIRCPPMNSEEYFAALRESGWPVFEYNIRLWLGSRLWPPLECEEIDEETSYILRNYPSLLTATERKAICLWCVRSLQEDYDEYDDPELISVFV